MAKKNKKDDQIKIPCSVKWKGDVCKAKDKLGLSYATYGTIAINEKMKRDKLGEE